MNITKARKNLRVIGDGINKRIEEVQAANPELTIAEVCELRPDLAIEQLVFNRCWFALED